MSGNDESAFDDPMISEYDEGVTLQNRVEAGKMADVVVKTESGEAEAMDGQVLSEHTVGSRDVEIRPDGDDFQLPQSQSLSLPPLEKMPTLFVCHQCGCQHNTLEEFIHHMRSAHLQHQQGGAINNSSVDDLAHLTFNRKIAKISNGGCCPVCGTNLPNRMDAKLHLAEHYMDCRGSWRCRKCANKAFAGTKVLREHLVQCHSQKLFRCTICLQIFSDCDDLSEHLMVQHGSREQKFQCVPCERDFDSRLSFDLHVERSHTLGLNLPVGQQNRGSLKPKMGTTADQNLAVKRECANANGAKNQPTRTVHFSSPLLHQTQKGLKCVVCDVQCTSELALDQHRLYEHCKVPHGNRCGVCRSQLDNLDKFVEHSLAHRNPLNEEINCVICRQSMRGDVQLSMHGNYHLGLQKTAEEQNGTSQEGHSPKSGGTLSPTTEEQTAAETFECQTCKSKLATEEEYAKHLLLHVVVETLSAAEGSCSLALLNKNNQNSLGESPRKGSAEPRPEYSINNTSVVPPSLSNCIRCGKTFDSFARLNAHMLEHLREKVGIPTENNKDDGGGTVMLVDEEDDGEHEQQQQGDCEDTVVQSDDIQSRKRGDTGASAEAGGKLKKGHFSSLSAERHHAYRRIIGQRKRHHKMGGAVVYKCRICDQRFANVDLLKMHSPTHSAKLCGRS